MPAVTNQQDMGNFSKVFKSERVTWGSRFWSTNHPKWISCFLKNSASGFTRN